VDFGKLLEKGLVIEGLILAKALGERDWFRKGLEAMRERHKERTIQVDKLTKAIERFDLAQ
jgi:hypothetical protein